ncbi:amidohydrolase family protein [Phytoactinopolyspora alkaliphila]|uniref:Amidohydrolase family protein n=1 Tax=Phytoactinopolyspora alkaliphila TaxID=1783498 RepID=A0A6N9YIZ5_9ACTN|nr:amidohydrolase family protein [Phytoactinopolyspora alkaliphila]NED94986.1 amidohydrolase family protein [Phytoactinopolyspora alkaliphila]
MAMKVDLVIRGGTVVDGSGSSPVQADVLVGAGRVVAIEPAGGGPVPDARVLDATSLAVAPGFIDIHTHSDVSVLLDGRAQSKVAQGVTTEVVGNCGFSPYPLDRSQLGAHRDLLAGIGDDPMELTWSDVDGYAVEVRSRGSSVNIVPLVGHGQLRIAANGLAEKASAGVIDTMRALLADLLQQGAFGMSTGLTYVPSRYASTGELEALCAVLADADALYATHARGGGPSAIQEAVELGRACGVRVQYSHIAINEPDDWGRAGVLLGLFDDARRGGVDIACDVYPYDASASALTQYLPPWVLEGGVEAMRARLADASTMRRAERDLAAGWGEHARVPWYWDRVVISRTAEGPVASGRAPAEGATIEKAAAGAGLTPERYVLELCRAGGNRVQVVLFYRTEADMREFLRHPSTVIGSDGSALPFEQHGRKPHPRAFGAHARVLGRYCRQTGDLDLATAVHRMSGAVADRLGLTDRGRLSRGAAADIVVFDPRTVADQATFTDPGRPPSGIVHVVVNGELVVHAGVQTPARPGRVLRSR